MHHDAHDLDVWGRVSVATLSGWVGGLGTPRKRSRTAILHMRGTCMILYGSRMSLDVVHLSRKGEERACERRHLQPRQGKRTCRRPETRVGDFEMCVLVLGIFNYCVFFFWGGGFSGLSALYFARNTSVSSTFQQVFSIFP